MQTIKWSVSRQESELIERIVSRAVRVARENEIDYDKCTALMDITAVHANGCKLRLNELIEADAFNFNHDVFGIRSHLDRTTGKLTGCFVPRFAV
jgi:hypothetical protein